jgi:hypothetical protein
MVQELSPKGLRIKRLSEIPEGNAMDSAGIRVHPPAWRTLANAHP